MSAPPIGTRLPTVSLEHSDWLVAEIERLPGRLYRRERWRVELEHATTFRRAQLDRVTDEAVLIRVFSLVRAMKTWPRKPLHSDSVMARSLVLAALVAPCDRNQGFRRPDLLRIAAAFATSPLEWGTA